MYILQVKEVAESNNSVNESIAFDPVTDGTKNNKDFYYITPSLKQSVSDMEKLVRAGKILQQIYNNVSNLLTFLSVNSVIIHSLARRRIHRRVFIGIRFSEIVASSPTENEYTS